MNGAVEWGRKYSGIGIDSHFAPTHSILLVDKLPPYRIFPNSLLKKTQRRIQPW